MRRRDDLELMQPPAGVGFERGFECHLVVLADRRRVADARNEIVPTEFEYGCGTPRFDGGCSLAKRIELQHFAEHVRRIDLDVGGILGLHEQRPVDEYRAGVGIFGALLVQNLALPQRAGFADAGDDLCETRAQAGAHGIEYGNVDYFR